MNPVAPIDAFLTDRGYLATLDNWHNMGYGKVVAFYDPTGSADPRLRARGSVLGGRDRRDAEVGVVHLVAEAAPVRAPGPADSLHRVDGNGRELLFETETGAYRVASPATGRAGAAARTRLGTGEATRIPRRGREPSRGSGAGHRRELSCPEWEAVSPRLPPARWRRNPATATHVSASSQNSCFRTPAPRRPRMANNLRMLAGAPAASCSALSLGQGRTCTQAVSVQAFGGCP